MPVRSDLRDLLKISPWPVFIVKHLLAHPANPDRASIYDTRPSGCARFDELAGDPTPVSFARDMCAPAERRHFGDGGGTSTQPACRLGPIIGDAIDRLAVTSFAPDQPGRSQKLPRGPAKPLRRGTKDVQMVRHELRTNDYDCRCAFRDKYTVHQYDFRGRFYGLYRSRKNETIFANV